MPPPYLLFVTFPCVEYVLKDLSVGPPRDFTAIAICTWKKTLRSPGHWIKKKKSLKFPEGSTPQVLLQISIAKDAPKDYQCVSMFLRKSILFVLKFFLLFLILFCIYVWRKMWYQLWAIDSIYSRYIYEFVLHFFNLFSRVTIFKEKGIMGKKYCPFMKMRMRIKAQVKATL